MPVNNNASSYFVASSPSAGNWHPAARRSTYSATGCATADSTYVQPQGTYGYGAYETTSFYFSPRAAQSKTQTSTPAQNSTKTAIYAPSQDPTKTAMLPTMQDETRTAIYAPSQDPTKTAIVQPYPTTVMQPSMDRNYYEAPYSTNVKVPLSTRTAVMQASSAQPKRVDSTESVYFGVSGSSNAKSSTPVNKAPAAASNVSVYFTAGTQGKAADTTTSVYFLSK